MTRAVADPLRLQRLAFGAAGGGAAKRLAGRVRPGQLRGRVAHESVQADTRSSSFQVYTSDRIDHAGFQVQVALHTIWFHWLETEWPAPHVWITRETRNRSLVGPIGWMGTQIDGMRDLTGQMYRRNRYYDPQSGRFTQEDPIGLAGGLNVYGFAAGDPVTYGDPYGLSPDEDDCCDKNDASPREIQEEVNRARIGASIGRGFRLREPRRLRDPAGAGRRLLPFRGERAREIENTLDRIEAGIHKYRQDGTRFRNREGVLPRKSDPDYYSEWTVETPGANYRARRRIVRGKGGETYYSDDHYQTFVQIDPRRH
jgi:RHS repeat-associated protein